MPPHRSRNPRWLWPVSCSLAATVLLALVAMPAGWWDALWPDGRLRHRDAGRADRAPLQLLSVAVVPARPPVRVADPADDPPPPTRWRDARWWDEAWNARIEPLASPPALPDTLPPTPLRLLWGEQATVEFILGQPDSVVARRLWRLVQTEQLGRDDLDGMFSAIAKARSYADMKRREAAMFDEPGAEQIRVPD